MRRYKTRVRKLSGSNAREVRRQAYSYYMAIKRRSKRRPYVRSRYFQGDKIFLTLFWDHLYDKPNWRDRTRRLKLFACAIELIKRSALEPTSKSNPNASNETLHRFYGLTRDNEPFCVQIKEAGNGQKFLMSVFDA